MRRADREVHDTAEIEGILRDCADVRVAYQDAQGLTIVPEIGRASCRERV